MIPELASKRQATRRFYRWFFVAAVIGLIDGVSSLTNGPLNFVLGFRRPWCLLQAALL